MAIVTEVKPQKNKKRVNIYLDGKFGFGLDLETFVKSGLKVEQELKDEEIEKIVKKGEFQKTYDKILRFATLRPRSEKEFRLWFRKHKVHESLQDELFNRLKRLELLDDEKFARWWIGQRLTFKAKGPKVLKIELYQKGISKDVFEQLISELVSQEDQINMAKKHVEKMSYRWKSLEGFEKRQKITQHLYSKGFDWDVIKKITDIDD